MDMTTRQTAKTPGYNSRLAIWFDHDKNGRKIAYHWSFRAFRAFRISVADAEMWIAQDLADRIDGHPLRPSK